MNSIRRIPRKGDRVQILGFLGTFEVVLFKADGTCDLRHLDSPGPDYIENQVFWRELVYLNPSQPEIGRPE